MSNTWDNAPDITVHNDLVIRGFMGEYRWLSNFWPCPVYSKTSDLTYPSSENAYQAAKFPKQERAQFVTVSANASKKMGKNGRAYTKEQWDNIKVVVMKSVVWAKFSQNTDLKAKLLATGEKYLEETNWWHDTFYGVCEGVGQNWLGKILMETRDSLRKLDKAEGAANVGS